MWDCPKYMYEARKLPEDGVDAVLKNTAGPVIRSVVGQGEQ